MAKWTAFPYAGEYSFDAASVKKKWARLHAGDLEPLPKNPAVLQAWVDFHNGEFHKAATAGKSLGLEGFNVANKATCVYATFLEKHEAQRLDLFMEVAKRSGEQIADNPDDLCARFWHAYALGRYSQGISVAKALAQGLGTKIKTDLEYVIRHQPEHSDAHVALGTYHAEVIDKVGSLIGAMAYGVNKDIGMRHFTRALILTPHSAYALLDYANGLLMLCGDDAADEAKALLEQAANLKPLDALERLDVELAKTELED